MALSGANLPGQDPAEHRRADMASHDFFRDPLILILFFLTLALYLVSMPKSVALEDDSIFILSGFFNGVAHPPGYPLFTAILNLFTGIPIGSVAARAHASSAFFAALGCCGLYAIFRLFGLKRTAAVLIPIVFSVSETFWSQSIVTEVYSLNVFLNLSLMLMAMKIHIEFDSSGQVGRVNAGNFYLFSIVLGLAVSNHWPLTLLALPGYLLLLARPYFALGNKITVLLPALAITMVCYLYLYINNQSSPPINFSGKFANLQEFIEFITRNHYASVDVNATAGWLDKWRFCQDFIIQILRELNVLLLFSALGFYHLLKAPGLRPIGLAISWVFISNSLLLIVLIDFDYSDLYSTVFRVYPIVAIAMLFVGAGLGLVLELARAKSGLRGIHITVFLILGLALNLYYSLPQNFRHHYSWAEEYAESIFSEIPQSAVVFSDGEVELGLLGYFHLVEGRRPDIKLYSSSGLLLENRLFDYRLQDKKAFVDHYVEENPHIPVYVVNNYYHADIVSASVFTEKLGKPDGEPKHSIDSSDIELILNWSADEDHLDPWTRLAIAELREKAIAIIAPTLGSARNVEFRNFLGSSIDGLIRSEADLLAYLRALIRGESQIDTAFYRQQLETIERERLPSKQVDSHYAYLLARSEQAQQTSDHVKKARRDACRNWPSEKNIYCSTSFDA